MPRIGLILPGEQRKTVIDVAEEYTITIARNDGLACTEIEASTVMTMWNLDRSKGQIPKRGQRRLTED